MAYFKSKVKGVASQDLLQKIVQHFYIGVQLVKNSGYLKDSRYLQFTGPYI
jgi:hypothetical protein